MSKCLEPGIGLIAFARKEWEKSASPYMLEMESGAERPGHLLSSAQP